MGANNRGALVILSVLSSRLAFSYCGSSPPSFGQGGTASLHVNLALFASREPAHAVLALPPVRSDGVWMPGASVKLATGFILG